MGPVNPRSPGDLSIHSNSLGFYGAPNALAFQIHFLEIQPSSQSHLRVHGLSFVSCQPSAREGRN